MEPSLQSVRAWEEIDELIQLDAATELERYVDDHTALEFGRAVLRLPQNSKLALFHLISPDRAAQIVEFIPRVEAVAILSATSPKRAALILNDVPSDDRADLLSALPAEHTAAILQLMDPQKTQEFLSLAKYPPDVAGGLMVKELVSYPEHFTVGDVLEDLRARAETFRDYDIQYAYVVRAPRFLVGVLRLRDLLLCRPHQRVSEIMVKNPIAVGDRATVDELEEFFSTYAFLGAPVVDAAGRLVGVVHRDAVAGAIADRGDSDYRKSQGIVGGEELRSMPLLVRSRRRLSWLAANIFLNVMAAGVIAYYQDTLAAVVSLAVFLPIVSDMSGNSGFQAIAVTMREMALGVLQPNEFFRVIFKELAVSLINGAALGLIVAGVALAWQGNAYLGLVVGVALALNTLLAACIGGVMPLLLRRMKLDPALASGPILTTITDMCGFFLVLSLASSMLPRLVDGTTGPPL